MGGKKKLSLSQMERMQIRAAEKGKGETKEKAMAPKEKRKAGIVLPNIEGGKVLEELKKMRVLTPYAIASRFNIRMSTAKDLLERLEDDGVIQLVSGNHNIKIYKTVD